jgi:hypothetical protein
LNLIMEAWIAAIAILGGVAPQAFMAPYRTNEIDIRETILHLARASDRFRRCRKTGFFPVLINCRAAVRAPSSRARRNSRTVIATRQPNLFKMAHFSTLSLATVGGNAAFEPLVQEFLNDEQPELFLRRKKWLSKRTAISRSEGVTFRTEVIE